jgi:Arm domain-containing DNA-binding protein/integrase-like protein
MGKWTKSAIDRLKQPKLHGDGDGLYLQIKEGRDGLRKSWLFRFQLPGARPRAMGLGSYPDVDLDAAREAARLARQLVAKGVDPIADRERAAAQAEVYNITYREAVARYAETMTPKWKRGAANFLWAQDKHVLPVLGGVRVTDITTQDVLQVFKPKWDKIPHMMWDTLHYVRHVLAFVRANGWSDPEKPNPAEWVGHLQHLLPQVPHSRKALIGHPCRGGRFQSSSSGCGKWPIEMVKVTVANAGYPLPASNFRFCVPSGLRRPD